jgi:RNA polymerase sigma-70 factor (ECF subfamily)
VRVAQARNLNAARCIPEAYARGQPEHLPPVDSAIVVNEEHRCLIDAIRVLPERQREMVTLHFLKEVSYDEIARALDVSVGTVKATVFQAKASLRSALAKKGIHRKANHVLS